MINSCENKESGSNYPIKYYKHGGVIYAVHGTSSINYVERLLAKIAAIEAAQEDGWQPIETAPKPDVGADGFGRRLLLVVDCGEGTTQSIRKGYWEGADWYLDCCGCLAIKYGYRVTHWRPLPTLPAKET